MKPLTLTFAALSLIALSACNTQQADNAAADNAAGVTDNLSTLDNGAAVDLNAADGKPVDGAGNEAAPAGDKPADAGNETATDEATGDKPAE